MTNKMMDVDVYYYNRPRLRA